MKRGRRRSTPSDRIRDLRIYFARADRADRLPWTSNRRAEILAARRENRRERRRLFALPAFVSIVEKASRPDEDLVPFVLKLGTLSLMASADPKAHRAALKRAKEEAEIAARVLTNYDPAFSQIAERIRKQPALTSRDLALGLWPDESLVGRDARSWAIRLVDSYLEPGAGFDSRFAAIADLVEFIGFEKPSRQLVRATLLGGET